MTQEHPITPPPELVREWRHDANLSGVPYNDEHWAYEQHIANRAAQWGADQELEACCEWLKRNTDYHMTIEFLRAARRPKPPSLKEQALETLETLIHGDSTGLDVGVIRRALEALPDD
jgi:hypothetical protein